MIQYLDKIKSHYEYLTPYIFNRCKSCWITPYADEVDWMNIFTPIEEQTWMALRSFGQLPLYPQYPVGNFFTDFGNPKLKLIIECDGKEWHQNKDKDNKRDKWLFEQGWHVYRISGADCFKITEEYEERYDMDERDKIDILNKYYNTIEGLIKALAMFYVDYKSFSEEEMNIAFRCLIKYISPVQYDEVSELLSNKDSEIRTQFFNYKYQD